MIGSVMCHPNRRKSLWVKNSFSNEMTERERFDTGSMKLTECLCAFQTLTTFTGKKHNYSFCLDYNIMLCYVMWWCYTVCCAFLQCGFVLRYDVLLCVVRCCTLLRYLAVCYIMSRYVALHYITLCHPICCISFITLHWTAMLCHVMWHCNTLCCSTSCDVNVKIWTNWICYDKLLNNLILYSDDSCQICGNVGTFVIEF